MNQPDQIAVEQLLPTYKNKSNRERSQYKNIPIALLPQVRQYFKINGTKIVVRYRGHRSNPLDRRPRSQRMQDCVKQFADRFTIYLA